MTIKEYWEYQQSHAKKLPKAKKEHEAYMKTDEYKNKMKKLYGTNR